MGPVSLSMVTSHWNRSAILLCVGEEGKGSRSGAEYSINHLNFNYLPSDKPMHKQLCGPQSRPLSLTKREPAGTMKKLRSNWNPALAGVSLTALVPEWRNWQTR